MGVDAGRIGLCRRRMYGTRDTANHWERDWQEYLNKLGVSIGARFE